MPQIANCLVDLFHPHLLTTCAARRISTAEKNINHNPRSSRLVPVDKVMIDEIAKSKPKSNISIHRNGNEVGLALSLINSVVRIVTTGVNHRMFS